MAKLLFFLLISASFLLIAACASKSEAPPKKQLSTQPHNRPASWEGQGGLGGMMGPQYSD